MYNEGHWNEIFFKKMLNTKKGNKSSVVVSQGRIIELDLKHNDCWH